MHILSFLGKTVPLPTSQPISDGSHIYEETNVGYNATNGIITKSNTAYNISMKKVSRLNGNDIHGELILPTMLPMRCQPR